MVAEIKYAATCDVSTYSFIQNRRFASVAALPLRECMFTHVRRVMVPKCKSVCALENAFIHFSGLDHNIVKPGPPCQNSYRRAVSSALTNMTSAHLMASAFAFAFYSYHNLLLFAYCVIINLHPHTSYADVTYALDSMPERVLGPKTMGSSFLGMTIASTDLGA